MKTFLSAGISAFALAAVLQPAAAADMPLKAPPLVVQVWSWDGWYLGLNGGYSWGRSRTTLSLLNGANVIASNSSTFDLNGGVFGGQIGFNRQSGRWVFGLESDLQWSGERGSASLSCNTAACLPTAIAAGGASAATLALNQRIDWFGTFRGRVGMTPTPTSLLYATGGLAYGGIRSNLTIAGFTATAVPTSTSVSNTQVRVGWTVGAGLETHLSGRWTGKIEYLYMDFGTASGGGTLATSSPVLTGNYRSRVTDNVLRVGVNYRWDSPIVARY